MFPIPWNKMFRKKDGALVTMDEAMSGGGGGGSIPPHSAEDAGKVLGVANDGTLAWISVSTSSSFARLRTTKPEIPSVDVKEVS